MQNSHPENSLPGAMELRVRCYELLKQWNVVTDGDGSYRTLKKLLGITDINAWCGTTEEQMNTMRGLCGPYGYAVYKMLLLKRNSNIS